MASGKRGLDDDWAPALLHYPLSTIMGQTWLSGRLGTGRFRPACPLEHCLIPFPQGHHTPITHRFIDVRMQLESLFLERLLDILDVAARSHSQHLVGVSGGSNAEAPGWNLYASDGKFVMDHVNDWQHSAMYSAFMLSGLVDLATWYGRLPEGIEHASLGMAFLIEGMLLVFHLKGPKIEILVHLILVIQIFLTVVAVVFEALMPTSFAAALARPLSTVIQGVWWIQTAYIMYRAKPQWDPEDMSSAMMAPVAWVTHVLWITAAMLSVFLLMRWVTERHLGWVYKEERGAPGLGSPMPAARYGAQRPSGRTNGHIDLELSALTSDKY
ncbi:Transmembrane protein 45B [Auxenochlorella protothecoides]|uniref:Transmembrane protein 45B n=1 Tax=Auxenochlorella protothecoides TaxID=3075 RepID=A0A087SDH8_AUXPR|nr:Transmembrane protein 45B [Auxenochlorella protothecoides]KFM23782.1 Transmembrane protein 45B [Auxenochlorella protothecoides]